MVDLGGRLRRARDRDELVDGLEQPAALASHVRDVHAAVRRGGLRERDELVGLRVERGRVDQRRADAERALFHRLRTSACMRASSSAVGARST